MINRVDKNRNGSIDLEVKLFTIKKSIEFGGENILPSISNQFGSENILP